MAASDGRVTATIAHVADAAVDGAQLCLRCRKVLWVKDSAFKIWLAGSHVLELCGQNALVRGPDVLGAETALCDPAAGRR